VKISNKKGQTINVNVLFLRVRQIRQMAKKVKIRLQAVGLKRYVSPEGGCPKLNRDVGPLVRGGSYQYLLELKVFKVAVFRSNL
jgi:hypothetical protein